MVGVRVRLVPTSDSTEIEVIATIYTQQTHTDHKFRRSSTLVSKPSGIDERLEQLRPPIIKAEGNTESERYLAKLADKSFLNLWSYPSPYRDQKQCGRGDGKELCDLLVVCGKHIIIFSEKTIGCLGGDLKTAWCRWAKKAIRDAAKQTKGAERWISEFPERLFLDRDCTVPFPIDLPSRADRQVHRVVVASGCAESCRNYFLGSSGSLIIKPGILRSDHWSDLCGRFQPFAVGDVDPDGSFVHVLNEAALDIVMSELDTVSDFTDYLTKKAAFVRSGQLAEAHGEENLLAYYAIRINEEGDHDFVVENGNGPVSIDHQQYERFISDPRYLAKKSADEISYLWDRLIEAFTNHMLDGTSITLEGHDFELRKNELGVRYMALVPRFIRRSHGEAIAGALQKGKGTDRFFRVMMGSAGSKDNETAFFIQTIKYLDWMEKKGEYERYRLNRSECSAVYARGLLERFPHLKRVVGVSCEPPDQCHGGSEDLVYVEQRDWTEEERAAIQKDCETYGVLQEIKERRWEGQEYPDVETITIERLPKPPSERGMNRKQRRAMKAKARKRK